MQLWTINGTMSICDPQSYDIPDSLPRTTATCLDPFKLCAETGTNNTLAVAKCNATNVLQQFSFSKGKIHQGEQCVLATRPSTLGPCSKAAEWIFGTSGKLALKTSSGCLTAEPMQLPEAEMRW